MKRSVGILYLILICWGTHGKSADPGDLLSSCVRQTEGTDASGSVDSLILSGIFVFRPDSFRMEPLGKGRQFSNPVFRIDFINDRVEVYLPYYRGKKAPFRISMLQLTVDPVKYLAIKDEDGFWEIIFTTDNDPDGEIRFFLEVSPLTWSATLTVASDRNNTIVYEGNLMGPD